MPEPGFKSQSLKKEYVEKIDKYIDKTNDYNKRTEFLYDAIDYYLRYKKSENNFSEVLETEISEKDLNKLFYLINHSDELISLLEERC